MRIEEARAVAARIEHTLTTLPGMFTYKVLPERHALQLIYSPDRFDSDAMMTSEIVPVKTLYQHVGRIEGFIADICMGLKDVSHHEERIYRGLKLPQGF